MIIAFNATMFTDFNHSMINASNTDIYVVPVWKRHLADGFNLSKLNFTWETESFTDMELKILMTFESPISISPLETQDSLVVNFREDIRGIFYSPEIKRFLEPEYYVMKNKVKKQIPNTALTATVEGAS